MMVALTWGTWRQHAGDLVGRAVVQEALPDPAVAAAGQQDGALGVAVEGGVGHQFDGGAAQPTVGALDDVERQAGQTETSPLLLQLPGLLGVDVEVHGPEVIGREGAGVLDGPGGGHVEPVHQDDDHVSAQNGCLRGLDRSGFEQHLLLLVLPVQADEADHAEGKDDHDRPCSLGEFR